MKETMAVDRASAGRPSLRRVPRFWRGWTFGWMEASFLVLVFLALGMRVWELGGRVMHYDEAIHVHFAWRLFNSDGALWGWPWVFGRDFIHAPWMHGPFQVELTAFIFRVFGDSDFTARLGYILFGTALVGLPYFLRDYLGRAGALLAGVMLALSPAMLYFSRFGRNDILMAFWATALLILMWRYLHERRCRYLYLASAVLALMFATKETTYIIVLILGAMSFLLALPDLVPWALGRSRLSQFAGPAGFLLLLATLTLPQWMPLVSLGQDALGLTLANPESTPYGPVGAPDWVEPLVTLPVYGFPWWLHGLAVAAGVAGLLWLSRRAWRKRSALPSGAFSGPAEGGRSRFSLPLLTRGRSEGLAHLPAKRSKMPVVWLAGVGVPLAAVAATALAMFRPLREPLGAGGVPVGDIVIAGALVAAAVATLVVTATSWRRGALLITVPALVALVYGSLFTNIVNVDSVVNGVLPSGVTVDASANGIPVNYLVAGVLLLGASILSVYLGVRWLGGRWLICAGVFYGIWVTLYTTFFTNLAGIFSGVWQGMGYWIAQQDVARGNQPWYYYFVGLSVYEILPVIFGALGAVYFLKKGDVLGLALTFWAGVTFLAYTVASEKMPWLLVNISLPFILLAGKYLGHLAERVRWRDVARRGQVALLVLPPLALAGAVYLLYSYVNSQTRFSGPHWALLFSTALLLIVSAYLVRLARPQRGLALVGLGMGALLLGFGASGAIRAAYTYDDSNKEILVYAQGSNDLRDTFRDLDSRVFSNQPAPGAVKVDYDIWYPLQWYVRQETKEDTLRYFSFPKEEDSGDTPVCDALPEEPDTPIVLLTDTHANQNCDAYAEYEQVGPFRNLLWFYEEAYRRPGENRPDEGFKWGFRGIPSGQQLTKDFRYFKEVATSRESWFDALDFLLFRKLEQDWYDSKYYSYLP